MRYDEKTIENIKKSIKAICQTAITVWNVLGEDGGELINGLDKIVESMIKVYEIEESVLIKYRATVESAEEMDLENKQSITITEAVNTRDMIFALCDNLTEPKQIMEYVRFACDLVNVWDS